MLPSEVITPAHYKITLKTMSAILAEDNLQRELLRARVNQLETYLYEQEQVKAADDAVEVDAWADEGGADGPPGDVPD